MRRRSSHTLFLIVFLAACSSNLPALFTPAPSLTPSPFPATPTPPPDPYYTGWAIVAYPEIRQEQMEADLRILKQAGANVIWIGHNNPGDVSLDKAEPGLSYAVYAASLDRANLDYAVAHAIIAAQHRMLRAARAVGLRAVFPIGYQIQMGRAWNAAHPEALRRSAAGEPLDIYGGGVSASFYSPDYRADIRRYYEWVREQFIVPYRDVILMINLADEPLGGDYSLAAEMEFRSRAGVGFAEAPPTSLGAFQDRVVVDYAIWSAQQWAELAPGLPVTLSLDGAQARWSYHLPDLEALFRDTPPNFVVSFDAYLHDAIATDPLTEAEVGALVLLARTLGHHSAQYQRAVWLWTAGNDWGLAAASDNPGDIGDALANGYLLINALRSTGGLLRGLVVWNYNVRGQGLLWKIDPAPYDRVVMFTRLSAAFPAWRALMKAKGGRADTIMLFSNGWVQAHIGETREAVLGSPINFRRLLPLARADVPLAIVGELPELEPTALRRVIVLDPTSSLLTNADLDRLRRFAAGGGQILSTPAIAEALGAGAFNVLPADPTSLDEAGWANALSGVHVPEAGLLISSPAATLFYQPGAVSAVLPSERPWIIFARTGQPRKGELQLGQHEFALSP
jgi:hypothetical protein